MLNITIIAGRLVRDPEKRTTQNGTSVTSFTVANDEDRKTESGGKETNFIDCVAWRNTADYVANYIGKGDLVSVTGRLRIRDWTDKEGNKHRKYEVVAENVYKLSYSSTSTEYTPSDPAREAEARASLAERGLLKGEEPKKPSGSFDLLEDDDTELPF